MCTYTPDWLHLQVSLNSRKCVPQLPIGYTSRTFSPLFIGISAFRKTIYHVRNSLISLFFYKEYKDGILS